MKYSFIIPYIDRVRHLHNTLLSYRHWYSERTDYEIILVIDPKNTKRCRDELTESLKIFTDLPIKLVQGEVVTFNPSPHYNLGFKESKGEYIIITNPECMHTVDILAGLDTLHEDDTYIVCACKNMYVPLNFNQRYHDLKPQPIPKTILWYQHSVHRNLQYHFCSSISRENYEKIGGFDERYIDGMGYDDLDIITTIRHTDMKIMSRDDLVVIHQQHAWVKPVDEVKILTSLNSVVFAKKWPGVKYAT